MSILSSLTSILEQLKSPEIGVPRGECDAIKPDDCGDGRQFKWNDDHKGRDDDSNTGAKNDYSMLGGTDDYSKDGNGDYSKYDSGRTEAKSNDCQPPKDYRDSSPPDDCGNGDIYRSPGEALAKLDFSHGDFGSQGPDHSGDMLGALAAMSSDDALEYAIRQMGPADHFDVGHVDVAADTSHDTDA